MAKMEYRHSESAYVGQASNGVWVRVDADEFGECVAECLRNELRNAYGVLSSELPEPSDEDYQREVQHWLEADEWVGLISQNDSVTDANAVEAN